MESWNTVCAPPILIMKLSARHNEVVKTRTNDHIKKNVTRGLIVLCAEAVAAEASTPAAQVRVRRRCFFIIPGCLVGPIECETYYMRKSGRPVTRQCATCAETAPSGNCCRDLFQIFVNILFAHKITTITRNLRDSQPILCSERIGRLPYRYGTDHPCHPPLDLV